MKKTTKKLSLAKETLRSLTAVQLAAAKGGMTTTLTLLTISVVWITDTNAETCATYCTSCGC